MDAVYFLARAALIALAARASSTRMRTIAFFIRFSRSHRSRTILAAGPMIAAEMIGPQLPIGRDLFSFLLMCTLKICVHSTGIIGFRKEEIQKLQK